MSAYIYIYLWLTKSVTFFFCFNSHHSIQFKFFFKIGPRIVSFLIGQVEWLSLQIHLTITNTDEKFVWIHFPFFIFVSFYSCKYVSAWVLIVGWCQIVAPTKRNQQQTCWPKWNNKEYFTFLNTRTWRQSIHYFNSKWTENLKNHQRALDFKIEPDRSSPRFIHTLFWSETTLKCLKMSKK